MSFAAFYAFWLGIAPVIRYGCITLLLLTTIAVFWACSDYFRLKRWIHELTALCTAAGEEDIKTFRDLTSSAWKLPEHRLSSRPRFPVAGGKRSITISSITKTLQVKSVPFLESPPDLCCLLTRSSVGTSTPASTP